MPSTVIRSYKYLPEKDVLIVTFISGITYQYFHVPKTIYDEFKQAFSKGTYFNKYIKPNHPFKKLED